MSSRDKIKAIALNSKRPLLGSDAISPTRFASTIRKSLGNTPNFARTGSGKVPSGEVAFGTDVERAPGRKVMSDSTLQLSSMGLEDDAFEVWVHTVLLD